MSVEDRKLFTLDRHGTYTINFPNRHALTNEEIKRRCSEFAPVLTVRAAGDQKGFRFVSFATEEHALAAIEGLKDDNKINLVERKPKEKEQTNSRFNNGNNHRNNTNKGQKNINNKNQKSNKKNNQDTDNDNSSQSSRVSSKMSRNKTHSESEATSNHSTTLEKLKEMRGVFSDKFALLNDKASSRDSSHSSVQGDFPPMPSLVPATHFIKSNVPEVFIAHEIVVANIHENYNPAFILHLFDRFEPIAITKIDVEPKFNSRFCHVYFKTSTEAIGAIKEFDNYSLLGKKLICIAMQ